MNDSDAGRILAVAIGLDPKMPQPDAEGVIRGLWAEALAGVPYGAAHRAVIAYYRSEAYAQHRDSVSPADIVGWWNARRRPTEAERTGTTGANRRALPVPVANPERTRSGVDAVRAMLAQTAAMRHGQPADKATAQAATDTARIRDARSRRCVHCAAEPGEPCVTGRGEPLTKSIAHPTRLTGGTP